MTTTIKEFLKQYNLDWTGDISTYYSTGFRKATEKDFNELDITTLLIKINENDFVEVSIEIDLANFYIVSTQKRENAGIVKHIELEKIKPNQDLSQEWINYQLKNRGMVYSAALKKYCENKKKKINDFYKEKEELLKIRAERLNKDIERIIKRKENELKHFETMEEKYCDIEKPL